MQESKNTWYADELMNAALTQRVCEDLQENMDEQRPILPECCACDEAKYEVTFEGLWSRHTHPKDFPADSWVTRFRYIHWAFGVIMCDCVQRWTRP